MPLTKMDRYDRPNRPDRPMRNRQPRNPRPPRQKTRRSIGLPIGRIFATIVIIALVVGGLAWLVIRVVLPGIEDLTGNIRPNLTVVPIHEHFSLDPSVTQHFILSTMQYPCKNTI